MNGKVHVMDHPLVAHKLTVLGTAYGKLVAGHRAVVPVILADKSVGLLQSNGNNFYGISPPLSLK